MSPLTIRVSGQSTISRHPERAVLKVTVKAEGSDKETISKEVTSTSNEIHKLFKDLSPKTEFGTATADAAVTVFSSTALSTWSRKIRNQDGVDLGRVHSAQSSFQAMFRNFSILSQVTGKLVTYPDVDIQSIEWRLTDDTQRGLGTESRKMAMKNAIQKAHDFAEVIGRTVVPVEVDDGGQRSFSQPVQQMPASMRMAVQGPLQEGLSTTSVADGNGALDMSPQDIRYTGSVDVKFEAMDNE